MRGIRLEGIQLFVEPVREHRFVLVLRGKGLSDAVSDTDPQSEGVAPLPLRATAPAAEAPAGLVAGFVEQARDVLKGKAPANMLHLRGFAKRPDWPSMLEVFRLRPAAVAYKVTI